MQEQIRTRASQLLMLVAALAAAAYMVQHVWPVSARFFPPALLLMVVIPTVIEVALVWRSVQIFHWLFPDQPLPGALPLSGKELQRHKFGAIISLLVSGVLSVSWVRSLL